jgi:hypothetical protein
MMLRTASSLVARPRLLPCLPAASSAPLWSPLQHRLFSRRRPPRVLSAAEAAASLRPWHTSDIVAYENLGPRIFQTISFLGSAWLTLDIWNVYLYTTGGLDTGPLIPLASMAMACVMLATANLYAKSRICRITLVRGGKIARISRHNLLGGVVDQECSVHLIRLLSDPLLDDKRKQYIFWIGAADGRDSSIDLVLDRRVRASTIFVAVFAPTLRPSSHFRPLIHFHVSSFTFISSRQHF